VIRPAERPPGPLARVEALRLASQRFEEIRPDEEGLLRSRLRPEQSRVAAEFGRFVRDAAEMAGAGAVAPFGRIVLPPRTGKTVVAAHLIARTRLPSVFIVPTRALVAQTAREMAAHAPSVPVGVFYGERKQLVDDGVNITTYAMLVAAWQAGRLPDVLRDAALVFADEGHRAMTSRRLATLQRAFAPSALRVALTATPNYDDPARRLELYFPALIHEVTMNEALSLGLLAPLRLWVAEVDADASTVEIVAGDFEGVSLGRLMSSAPFFRAVELFRYGSGNAHRPCLVACASRQQAHDLVEYLNARGSGERKSVRLLLGETPEREREEALAAFESGQADTLVQVGVLIEGWSSPRCKLLLDLAPSLSLVRATQKFFRVMTPHQGEEARIYMLLPAGLPALPILPTEIFAGPSADDYECGALLGGDEDGKGTPKLPVDATTGSPIAGVNLRRRVLLTARMEEPRLNPGAADDVRAVLATCPDWSPSQPAPLPFFRWFFFRHELFLGRGDFLLRWLGVPRTTAGYFVWLARLYPEVVANRILADLGDPDAGCDEDRRALLDELGRATDDGAPTRDFATGWRAATGFVEPPDWPDARRLARERKAEVSLLLDQLTRRKRRLVVERFGLEGREGATFEELAEAEQVSRGRMGQLIKAALRKLAHGAHFDEAGHVRWRLVGPRAKPGDRIESAVDTEDG
jgi:Type III restriction enzyme, res subunit/Sigma-70, region 4